MKMNFFLNWRKLTAVDSIKIVSQNIRLKFGSISRQNTQTRKQDAFKIHRFYHLLQFIHPKYAASVAKLSYNFKNNRDNQISGIHSYFSKPKKCQNRHHSRSNVRIQNMTMARKSSSLTRPIENPCEYMPQLYYKL